MLLLPVLGLALLIALPGRVLGCLDNISLGSVGDSSKSSVAPAPKTGKPVGHSLNVETDCPINLHCVL